MVLRSPQLHFPLQNNFILSFALNIWLKKQDTQTVMKYFGFFAELQPEQGQHTAGTSDRTQQPTTIGLE